MRVGGYSACRAPQTLPPLVAGGSLAGLGAPYMDMENNIPHAECGVAQGADYPFFEATASTQPRTCPGLLRISSVAPPRQRIRQRYAAASSENMVYM